MSSGSYRQVHVICPFYKHDDGNQKVTCTGIIGDNSSTALIFHHKNDYIAQMDIFCCEHYQKCEVYRMLKEIYEEE